ncbi:hypothetical protein BHE75_02076 [Sphingomonas haloaromaticamans]|uniref:Uncharacterized protein n=1 Tax=Edaphosphingomonas haloaromaticamans TaxID=653954 RepID=A0A1S1HE51_9SPHN|nr:hypothetical protein BHE75_02076 [Sphingomonas haloaromaticamans]
MTGEDILAAFVILLTGILGSGTTSFRSLPPAIL